MSQSLINAIGSRGLKLCERVTQREVGEGRGDVNLKNVIKQNRELGMNKYWRNQTTYYIYPK